MGCGRSYEPLKVGQSKEQWHRAWSLPRRLVLRRKQKAHLPEVAGADRMLDRRAQPPRRTEIVLVYVIAIVCSVGLMGMMPGGFEAPLLVWVFFVVWGILLGYMYQRGASEYTGPKPWVERRKTPRP